MASVANGKYIMGIELLGDHTSKMVLIPLGARNIPNWFRAITIDEEQFGDLMRERSRRRHEAEEANRAKTK